MSDFERKPLRYYWQVEILDGQDRPFSWLRLWRRVRRNRMLKSLAKGINNRLIQRHGIEIMLGAQIDEGLRLSHMQGG